MPKQSISVAVRAFVAATALAASAAQAGTLTSSLSFDGANGGSPDSGFIAVEGNYYATTQGGGARKGGTVIQLTPSGVETVVHAFSNKSPSPDGPTGPLVLLDDALYGTTYTGGQYGYGAVYGIGATGAETTIYSFQTTGTAPFFPNDGLVAVGSTLYGITESGGAFGQGTVFSLTTSGVMTVIHSFAGTDGGFPKGRLTYYDGLLYGTTSAGGGSTACPDGGIQGCGTVFSLSTTGTLTTLHAFDSSDGSSPEAVLTFVGTTLYGTTLAGGAHGYGSVFAIAADGSFTTLHSFQALVDGYSPLGGLTYFGGVLYGTTAAGGTPDQGSTVAKQGTVYAINPSGSGFTTVYTFAGPVDNQEPLGGEPEGELLPMGTALLGMTTAGGPSGVQGQSPWPSSAARRRRLGIVWRRHPRRERGSGERRRLGQ